jgi:hypothetical protein
MRVLDVVSCLEAAPALLIKHSTLHSIKQSGIIMSGRVRMDIWITACTMAASTRMIVFDSLPYVESVHEDCKQYAMALIEDEIKKKTTTVESQLSPHPHLLPLLQELPLRNAHLEKEYNDRILRSSHPTTTTTEQSDSLPIIPPDENSDNNPNTTTTSSTVTEWQDAVRKAKLAYEKERLRSFYLDLQDHSEKLYNETILDPQHVAYRRRIETQTQTIHQINAQRKAQQTEMGHQLSVVLQTQYHELIEKHRALKLAICPLERELLEQGPPAPTTIEPNPEINE